MVESGILDEGVARADFNGADYGDEYVTLKKGERLVLQKRGEDGDEVGWAYGFAMSHDNLKFCEPRVGWFPTEYWAAPSLSEREVYIPSSQRLATPHATQEATRSEHASRQRQGATRDSSCKRSRGNLSNLAKCLRTSSEHGNVCGVRDALARKCDPDASDSQGCTPLHYAATGHGGPEILETMRALLEAMADPNFQCNAGSTPLDYAVYWALKHSSPQLRSVCMQASELLQQYGGRGAMPCASEKTWAKLVNTAPDDCVGFLRRQTGVVRDPVVARIDVQTDWWQHMRDDGGATWEVRCDKKWTPLRGVDLSLLVEAYIAGTPGGVHRCKIGRWDYEYSLSSDVAGTQLNTNTGRRREMRRVLMSTSSPRPGVASSLPTDTLNLQNASELGPKNLDSEDEEVTSSVAASSQDSLRGRSPARRQRLDMHAEVEDWIKCSNLFRELNDAIDCADRGSHRWDSVWELIQRVNQGLPRCHQCRQDLQEVPDALQSLKNSWGNWSTWHASLKDLKDVLRRRLLPPEDAVDMPVAEIKYSQHSAGDTFTHGKHAGRSVIDVAEDIVADRIDARSEEMTLDVVLYHGAYLSLNNRHLYSLKQFLRQVQPELMRRHVQARVYIWPLTSGLRLWHGSGRHDIIDKFCDAYSTRDRGRSLSLRSRSNSRGSDSRPSSRSQGSSERRVRFIQ